MKIPSFLSFLTSSKEDNLKNAAPQKEKTQKIRADLEMAKLDEKISSAEQKIIDFCATPELNYDAILDAIDTLELTQRRKTKFEEIVKQLFPAKP